MHTKNSTVAQCLRTSKFIRTSSRLLFDIVVKAMVMILCKESVFDPAISLIKSAF